MYNVCLRSVNSTVLIVEYNHLFLFVLSLVLDINDESPTFYPTLYNISLAENVPRDYIVARLNCSDADSGLNAELSYFITGTEN